MQIAFGGLIGIAVALITEREDGTLLGAKAVPNGMLGYLIGKILLFSGMSLISLAIILVPSALLFDGLQLGSPGSLVSVEVGDSWRHLETLGVLGIWSVIGLVLAPVVLRRMARRESCSSVAERRERAVQRVH